MRDLAGLSLMAGHSAVYDALNAGRADIVRLRQAVGSMPWPVWSGRADPAGGGHVRLAAAGGDHQSGADVLPRARAGEERGQMIPGWPYSFVAVLGPGASSWTAPLDPARLGPHK